MTQRPGNVRDELLSAAIELLRTDGAAGATARAICNQVGVGPPALYHHYGSLDRLHHAAVDVAFEKVVACYSSAEQAGGPLHSIRNSWHMLMQFARENPQMYGLINQQIIQGKMPPLAQNAFDQMVADLALLAQQQPLRHNPATAAKMLWAGGLGAATFIASAALGGEMGLSISDQVNLSLGDVMLEALLDSL